MIRHGPITQLDLQDIHEVVELLLTKRSVQLVNDFGIRPERALVLGAGVTALEAISKFYVVQEITITRQGIREGTLAEVFGIGS
jgi:exopolyphosphatase/pppGpp-phosphohydrolase